MSEEPVLVEQRGSVLLITLNRPDQRNAIDSATADAIESALDRLDSEDELSVGVITGAGKGFCAGMDLKAFASGGKRPWGASRGFAGIVRKPPRKPMIAALEGFAVAGGFEIALACDLIVASKGTKVGVPEVKRGLVAAGGALRRLPQRLPRELATELILTGELITADRAYELGAISRLTEPGKALDAALELAETIGANGPLALIASKEVLDKQDSWTTEEFWTKQDEITPPVFDSEDAKEGAVAFAEKRDPVWKGR
jgi:enoyl-CoA hydratase/carnithine racemase